MVMRQISKLSMTFPTLLLSAGIFFNAVAASSTDTSTDASTDEWFELLIEKMCELTEEKGKVGEVGTEAVDYVLKKGYATELTTYAMSVGDQGFGEAIAKGLLAKCPGLYP